MLSTNILRTGFRNANLRFLSTKVNIVNEIVNKFNVEIRSGGVVPVFKLAAIFDDRVAVQDHTGEFTYRGLFNAAKVLSNQINDLLGGKTQKTVAYLCNGDSSHVCTQWAIWMTGNIAVPLSPHHPTPLLEYYLQDSGASLVICDQSLAGKLPEQQAPTLMLPPELRSHALLDPLQEAADSSENAVNLDGLYDGMFYASSDAIIMYTSGTTSKPKGVVHGFDQLSAQVSSLHAAWRYHCTDTFLHCLPLHHIHGLVNSVLAGLSAGAKIRMMLGFSSPAVWAHLLGMKKRDNSRITVFMGVPTMYAKLIEEYDKVFATNSRHREYIKSVLKTRMRLMICGSAPLPSPVFERWEDISGHRLLERYGMTEIGMALSNPYESMAERTPGCVGFPLPGVTVKLEDKGTLVTLESPLPNQEINLSQLQFNPDNESTVKNLFVEKEEYIPFNKKCKIHYGNDQKKTSLQGEIQVRGPGVFRRYWQRPEQTKAEFTEDGWFKTGDTGLLDDGKMRIQGRTSVDIIKSGGYKISALEVETLILGHPSIADVAVLGLPDPTWGEKVAAAVEVKSGITITVNELQEWGSQFAPRYQLPSALFIVPKLPRNAMGKVNKKDLRKALLNPIKEEIVES